MTTTKSFSHDVMIADKNFSQLDDRRRKLSDEM
jgi:hypothetical protein